MLSQAQPSRVARVGYFHFSFLLALLPVTYVVFYVCNPKLQRWTFKVSASLQC